MSQHGFLERLLLKVKFIKLIVFRSDWNTYKSVIEVLIKK
jgi:hypothetical protein